jgi:hypothetical protein
VLIPHAAVEPLLGRGVARRFEVHLAELRFGIALGRRGLPEGKQGCCRQKSDRDERWLGHGIVLSAAPA